MNSVTFKMPAFEAAPASWQPPGDAVKGADPFQTLAQLRTATKPVADGRQRLVSIVGACAVQAGLALALIFGTHIKAVLHPPPLAMVQILDEVKQQPVVPPPQPHLVAPNVTVVTLPPLPEIVAPPPPVPLPPAPTAITTSNTSQPVTPPVAIVESYQVRLLRYLATYRRYPTAARFKHQEGVAYVRFSIDRHGNVLSASLEKSSRFAPLDEEALAVFTRANPLPAPPPEFAGDPLLMVMPVEFSLH